MPRIYNTCAIYTVLFFMYHMRCINYVVESEFWEESRVVANVMQILDDDRCDVARYYIGKNNPESQEIMSGQNSIDSYLA